MPGDDRAGTDALFEWQGDRLVPTELSRGPWSPDALHGGPVAGLVTWAVEPYLAPGPGVPHGRHLARLSVDLLRPVPLAPLAVRAEVVRPGRRLQVVDVTVEADRGVVASARAVCVGRLGPDDGAPEPSTDDLAEQPPDVERFAAVPLPAPWPVPVFHADAIEARPVIGGFGMPGRGSAWIRLRYPLVAGEPLTALQRVATLSDFASGLSSEVTVHGHTFINADITVSAIRPAVGEWIALTARSHYGEPGSAVALASVWDRHGRIGAIAQSLVIGRPR